MTILVTGGAGFIGSNFVRDWYTTNSEPIITLDKLTYAGNKNNLAGLSEPQHQLVVGDIADGALVSQLLEQNTIRAIIHCAAESHVDRSISGPAEFIQTNIVGTFTLLEAARTYWEKLPAPQQKVFRFLHVSTDEVYGSLNLSDPAFTEQTRFAPNSPYSASKASADHLVRSYFHTYGLPVLTSNCSNNYGPYQFPEKLIPLCIARALAGEPLPIYGDGKQIRDWLYVTDHCTALRRILDDGEPGETYNIGGNAEKANVTVVYLLCDILDRLSPRADGKSYATYIAFVPDRQGHDYRYAVDCRKVSSELNWHTTETFTTGMEKTVAWYLANKDWVASVTSGQYRQTR